MKYPPKILKNPEVLMLQYQGTFDQRKDGWHSSESEQRVQRIGNWRASKGKTKATKMRGSFLLVEVGPRCQEQVEQGLLVTDGGSALPKQCTTQCTVGWPIEISGRVFSGIGAMQCQACVVFLGRQWETCQSLSERHQHHARMLDLCASHISTKSILHAC